MVTETQDTEITLGTGKMLVLFFGLVALCSAFFALGFKVGKGSGLDTPLSSTVNTTGTARPSTTKPTANPSDLTFYKSVGQDNPTAPASVDNAAKTQAATTEEPKPVSDPMTSPASGSYFVQYRDLLCTTPAPTLYCTGNYFVKYGRLHCRVLALTFPSTGG